MAAIKACTKVEVLCHENVYGVVPIDGVEAYAKHMYDVGMMLANM